MSTEVSSLDVPEVLPKNVVDDTVTKAPVEPKVYGATFGLAVTHLIVTLLGATVFKGQSPDGYAWLGPLVSLLVDAGGTFLGGYLAPHQARLSAILDYAQRTRSTPLGQSAEQVGRQLLTLLVELAKSTPSSPAEVEQLRSDRAALTDTLAAQQRELVELRQLWSKVQSIAGTPPPVA